MSINTLPAVIIDSNVLATYALTFSDTIVRQPDFVDEVAGTAAWIGEDGAVEVEMTRINDLARMVRQCGGYARAGKTPADFGISLMTFDPEYTFPAYKGWTKERVLTAWAEFAEILSA